MVEGHNVAISQDAWNALQNACPSGKKEDLAVLASKLITKYARLAEKIACLFDFKELRSVKPIDITREAWDCLEKASKSLSHDANSLATTLIIHGCRHKKEITKCKIITWNSPYIGRWQPPEQLILKIEPVWTSPLNLPISRRLIGNNFQGDRMKGHPRHSRDVVIKSSKGQIRSLRRIKMLSENGSIANIRQMMKKMDIEGSTPIGGMSYVAFGDRKSVKRISKYNIAITKDAESSNL